MSLTSEFFMAKLLYMLRGNFQVDNNGDKLINDYLICELASHIDVDILYFKSNLVILETMNCSRLSNVTLVEWSENLEWKIFFDLLKRKSQYEYYCAIPGGYGRPNGINSRYSYIKKIITLFLLQMLGLKCIWICKSQDVLPIPEIYFEKMAAKYLYRFSVRDSISRNNNSLNVEIWPDLAFLMSPKNTINKKSIHRKIIFSFRGNKDTEFKDFVRLFCLERIRDGTDEIEEIICLSNVKADQDYMKNFSVFLQANTSIPIKFIYDLDFIGTLELYNEYVTVFTDRLHVALPAMINHAKSFPLIDLTTDWKIVGIYEDMGWGKFIIPRSYALKEFSINSQILNLEHSRMDDVNQLVNQTRNELRLKIKKIFS